jgi:regulator of protease activity HflC (stomatin/prohibitin superfamily)
MAFISGLLPIFIFAIAVGRMAFKVIDQYEAGVIFRFGRLGPLKAPGLRFILPFVDRLVIVDQRTITIDIPQQDVITKDNVSVKVSRCGGKCR